MYWKRRSRYPTFLKQVPSVQGDRPRDREAVWGGGQRRRRLPEGGRGQGRGRRRRQRHLRHAHIHPLQGGEKGEGQYLGIL